MISTVPSNYDIMFLGIIALSAIIALFRGAVAEVLSLVVWASAFWLMRTYGFLISNRLPSVIPQNMFLRDTIVFILVFILAAIVAKILKIILSYLIKGIGLGGLNYALGLVFGLLRGVFICAILIIVISMFRLDPNHSYEGSRLYPFLQPCINWIASSIPQRVSI